MKDFIQRLINARRENPRQQELARRGKYRDQVLDVYGTPQAYEKDLRENPIEPTPIEAFIKKLISIREN